MKLFKKYDSVTREELEIFIGPMSKSKFFTKALDNYLQNPNKKTWCWSAFLVGSFWFIYRKALLIGLILSVIQIAWTLVLPMPMSTLLSVALFIFLGIYGSNIYLDFASRTIMKYKSLNQDLNAQSINSFIRIAGGISLFYPLAVYTIIQLTINLFI